MPIAAGRSFVWDRCNAEPTAGKRRESKGRSFLRAREVVAVDVPKDCVHLHDVLGEIAPALQLHAWHCGLCSVAFETAG